MGTKLGMGTKLPWLYNSSIIYYQCLNLNNLYMNSIYIQIASGQLEALCISCKILIKMTTVIFVLPLVQILSNNSNAVPHGTFKW